MIILGFSHGHDSGAALYKDGEILVSISDERLSRHKKNAGYVTVTLPLKSINYCLDYAGITADDVDIFIYNETQPRPDVTMTMKYHYGVEGDRLKYVTHHLAHAACSVFTSTMDECGIVISDTMGDSLEPYYPGWDFFSENGFNMVQSDKEDNIFTEAWTLLHYKDGNFINIENNFLEVNITNWDMEGNTSIGFMYSSGADQLVGGMTLGNAGKLMGLSSFADKDWVSQQPRNYTIQDDKLIIQNKLFNPEVNKNSPFQDRANVAGLYQREQEETSQFLVEKVKRLTGTNNITVGGGSFLNCNTNTNIIKSDLFEKTHFFASSDDSGIPMGCALYAALIFDKPNRKEFFNPYLGKEYGRETVVTTIEKFNNLNYREYDNFDELTDVVSNHLLSNKTVGWYQGGSELGPRALGNRSILANPSCPWMTDYINAEIKKREWFRPFAPSVLYEHQQDIFDLDYFSPYMLLTAEVKDEWKHKIPAVVHVDGTSRYQSVTEETNQRYYKLINSFYSKSGIPLLLNTSFNGPTEPIVETPEDAIKTFMNENLDILVINDFVITR